MDKALTVNGTAIQAYGEREQVGEIVDRLMKLHPAAHDVGLEGMRAVAQLAVMVGANPLPGANEIYIWRGRQNGPPQIDLGIAYYRRKASEKDTVMWIDGQEPRPMTTDERDRHHIPADAMAAICKGFILSKYLILLDKGVPWDAAQKMLGRTSIAVVAHDEMHRAQDSRYKGNDGKPTYVKGDPMDPPTGRTWQWVAEKRAEKGFYRMLSLVDTTLTDAMQEQAQQVLRQVRGEREPVEGENPFSDMSLDEMNEMFFDTPLPPKAKTPKEEPIEGEYVEDEETAVIEQPPNAGLVADIRADIESETGSMPLGDLIGEVVKTGEYADADQVYSALEDYKFPARFKLVDAQTVTRAGALKIYDWLMEFAIGE